MKIWLIYLLIPIMLIQCNMTLVISTSFYYNQNYIEKYICVQRSMQNNSCHGQCYLMQKLKKQQEKEQQSFKINFQEGTAVQHQLFSFAINSTFQEITTQYSLYSSKLYPRDYNASLYRPPVLA